MLPDAGDLVRALPDLPRWVETRSMLLSGDGEVLGLDVVDGGPSFVVVDASSGPLISVVGTPAPDAIDEAVARAGAPCDVLAFPENRPHVAAVLSGWRAVRAVLHLLGDAPQLPDVSKGSVRLLSAADLLALSGIPDDLVSELRTASRWSPIAAACVGGRPVSFCYVASETEGLWDISIDTLEEHRRHGHAARCVAYMIEHMKRLGKEPVWGAEETNPASLGLAARLGFVPVDELYVLHPPLE